MDKLEPIIKYRFWIILGITIPLVLFAYYFTSASMIQATTAREEALNGVISGISNGQVPNQDYETKLKKIVGVVEQKNQIAVNELWLDQKRRMTWPPRIAEYVPQEYRGEFDRPIREVYKTEYPFVVDKLYEAVEPYLGENIKTSHPQKVIMDKKTMPQQVFSNVPINSEKMWDTQEDVWLVQILFDAIRRTNADAESVLKSPVRRIDKLVLVGGTGISTKSEEGASVTSSMSSGDMSSEAYADYQGAEYGGDGGGMGGAGGGSAGFSTGSIGFDVTEEFGSDAKTLDDTETSSSSSGDMSSAAYGSMGMGMGMGGGAGGPKERYIGFEEDAPFRERGFYMTAIVDQTKIEDFLIELSSSPWPIRIGRFHIGPNPYNKDPYSGVLGGSGGRGAMASAYGGGFGGGFGSGFGDSSNYDTEQMDYGDDMASGMGSSGTGSIGMNTGTAGIASTLPKIDPSILANPNLVQIDLCGIITMYNPVSPEVAAAIEQAQMELEAAAPGTGPPEVGDPAMDDPAATTPMEADAPSDDVPLDENAMDETGTDTPGTDTPGTDTLGTEAPASDPSATTGPASVDLDAPDPDPAGSDPSDTGGPDSIELDTETP